MWEKAIPNQSRRVSRLGLAPEDELAPIVGRKMDVEHLPGGEFVEQGPRS
jgi:hypothetical protein